MIREAADRRASRSKEGNKDAESMTNPSRSRAERAAAYGSETEIVMLVMKSEMRSEHGSRLRSRNSSYATFVTLISGL